MNNSEKKRKRGRKPKKDVKEEVKEDVKEEVKEDVKGDDSFFIKCTAGRALRIFFNELKNYCDIITLNISREKICILEIVDTVLIHSSLKSDNFEYYDIDSDIKLHINLKHFCNVMKNIKNNDTICFKKGKSDTFWTLEIQSDKNVKCERYTIDLIKRDDYVKHIIDPVEFNYEITMPSEDYEDLIRKTKNIKSDKLTFLVTKNYFSFSCNDDDVSCEVTFGNSSTTINKDAWSDIFLEHFPYNKLALCTGFSKLCSLCYLYLKEDYPLIIKFNVAYLGDIKLCFAPVQRPGIEILL